MVSSPSPASWSACLLDPGLRDPDDEPVLAVGSGGATQVAALRELEGLVELDLLVRPAFALGADLQGRPTGLDADRIRLEAGGLQRDHDHVPFVRDVRLAPTARQGCRP